VSKVGDTGMNKSGFNGTKLAPMALLCALGVNQALAAITLTDVDFTALPGNEFEMDLQFSEPPPAPQSYTLENPARIVLDFPGVESSLEKKKLPLAFENAQSAVVLTAEGKTRVILNLNSLTPFDTSVSGNSYHVVIGEAGLNSAVEDSEDGYSSTTSRISSSRAISNVDFSRGEVGEGLVKLSLNNSNVSVDVQQVGSKILLSFFNTDLPNELDRKLDVIDFATPVKSIDAKQEGTTTKLVIDALGEYDYLAYQADGQYIVSVKPLTDEELAEKNAKFAFVGEKLSLNFQDIEVRSVLQLIADFTDLNLVASDTVSGNITLRLDNVPWDQALDIVLKAKGLDKRLEGNVLMVAPAAEIAERERLQVEANKQLQELAPLVTEFVRVKYADAKELFELFDVDESETGGNSGDDNRTATKSILSERGSAIVDQRTNTIILTDTEEKILEFKRLVDKIDIPVRQVEIAARIVVATTDFSKEVGVRWGIAGVKESGGNLFTVVGTREGQKENGVVDAFTIDSSEIDEDGNIVNDSALTLGETLAVDLGVKDQGGPSGSISLGFLSSDISLDMELSALESSGYGEIASQPKLLTGDKQKAVIRSGQEIAYQEATSSGATSVEFKEAVLKLEVTPQITPDNRVILDLFISQDNVSDLVVSGEPALDITDIETQALVGDGQTLVLGGIFQYQELTGEEKVPLLGDIPYVGRLFKNKLRSSEKREILIFITPKIIDDQLLDR
jgi:type IV pilus assembly protein PilQ